MNKKLFVSLIAIFCVVISTPGYDIDQNFADTGKIFPSTLIFGQDSKLYGNTGGIAEGGFGQVFSLTLDGEMTVIHEFDGINDGSQPTGGPVILDGNLYDVTAYSSTFPDSAVWEMTTDPNGEIAKIIQFFGDENGGCVAGDFTLGSDGNFYTVGTCGGDNGNGVVLKITPSGIVTVLHSFMGMDGTSPTSAPIRDTDGTLRGTTAAGGIFGGGTAYKITSNGTFTKVYDFPNLSGPGAGLIHASDGNYYGCTTGGGNNGSVYQMTPAGDVTFFAQSQIGLSYDYGLTEIGGLLFGVGTSETPGESIVFTCDFAGNFKTIGTLDTSPHGSLTLAEGNLYGPLTTGEIMKVTLPWLPNISTRMNVGTGDNVMIGGFIVKGTHPKKVVLRAIGPSLSDFDISGALANPTLELHGPAGAIVATNDNWEDSPNKQEIIDNNLAPTNALESAILKTLSPGAYTAIVRGVNNTTGVALVEAYDVDMNVNSQLVNISTRGLVQTVDNIMIGGFILTGSDVSIVLRAIGPSLGALGIGNPLANPFLELHDSNGEIITTNDNWSDSSNVQEIIDSGLAPTEPSESVILMTLEPGAYTAIVRGVDNTTGVALVEAYQVR